MRHAFQPSVPDLTLPELPEFLVPTATIIVNPTDLEPAEARWLVLIARSRKHSLPVLPGGRVEASDRGSCFEDRAFSAAVRELEEEIGVAPKMIRHLLTLSDPERDVRIVPWEKVSSLAGAAMRPISGLIRARYGCPDALFVASVASDAVRSSEELSELRFVDIRRGDGLCLAAGHGRLLEH